MNISPIDYLQNNVYKNVLWGGYSLFMVESNYSIKLNCEIQNLWRKNILPYQMDDKHWIVGYNMTASFFYCTFQPIICGPKRPSKLRKIKYFKVKII